MMGFGLLGLLFLGGVLVLALLSGAGLLSRNDSNGQRMGEQRWPTARQVLDERLARGEIGREEYESIRVRLEN
jgi:uncharacterized membrane protein